MKNIIKVYVATALMMLLPIKSFTQPTPISGNETTVSFDITTIDNFDERIFFLYNLVTDGRFEVITSENDGVFVVSASDAFEGIGLRATFADFREQNNLDFLAMSKEQAAEVAAEYKGMLPFEFTSSLMMDYYIRSRQNNTCANADPFCTDNGMYEFPAGVNAGSGETGPYYDCLYTTPNPAWYYMRILNPGNIDIYMYSTPQVDIDFCCWGPFADPITPCPNGLTSDKVVSCSYSTSWNEHCLIPSTAQTGEYYILVITNYSNSTCNINFSKVAGTGTTDCGILPPLVDNNGPYCVGETISLTANGQSGASYSWTGPGGFTSTQQNPTRPNCTMAMAGTYTCTIAVGSATNSATTEVIIYPMPTANFTFTTVCVGNATQFTNTSTTNPAGQTINSFEWTFGDGQTGTGANPTHTYAQAGTYQVTLTVSTGGHCTSTKTQTVTVNPQPTANFTATTVCQGTATQFTSTSTGQGITSYQWNFGDGQTGTGQNVTHTYAQAGTYQVTLTVNGDCSDDVTLPVTVNPQPTANFTATTVCQGTATQFTSTATGQGITSYQWNFGDGQTGTGANPTHTYAQSGTYQVTLTVNTNGNCSDDVTLPVTVNAVPTSNFTYTSVCRGNPTQFTSTATGQGITSYQWNFGDGQTGTGQNVTHTYAQAGDYQVTLTVTTNGNCSDQKTQTVPVYASPVASATAQPNTVMYGATSNLSANAGATGTFNFHWEPANMVVNPDNQTTATVPLQNTQTYTVTVTNPQGGCTSTAQVTVSIDGSNMSAMASADQNSLCIGESTTLHALPSGGTGNYTFSWTPANTLSNANIQDPVATPPLGSTTYTCHVSDGYTDVNVSVTIVVHPNVESDIYQTICENDHFDFFGESLQAPGVYDHTLQTQFGCDSVVHLHLANWDIYETPVSDRFCENETYSFYGQTISEPGVYYHTLESVHGCDSVIRINLTTNPVYEFELFESTCEGGPGYFFNGDYLHPRPEPYYYNFETTLGCDSLIILHVGESEYNSRSYNVSICAEEYTWASNGITFYESGVYYDTIHYEESCDSTLILNLELRPSHQTDIVMTSCDDYRWQNDEYHVDMTFSESTVYTQHYINAYGCESEATLYLTINDHDEYEFTVGDDENCDEYFWDPGGHEIVYTDHEGLVYDMSGVYHRTYKNQADCDSLVTMNVRFEYTPHPTPIYPMDANNGAPHWVVTATEFQINSYDFNLWDENPNCHWDTVTWTCEGAPEWVLEPFGAKAKCCKVYVLNHLDDTVWLTARAFNRCAPHDGVEQRYWLIPSFYGVDENEPQCEFCSFDVLPNPNKGQMTLNFEYLTGKVNVRVYDMRGTLIDQFTTFNGNGPSQYTYNMRTKSDGIYFFVATSKEGTVAKKVVIQK